MVPDFLDTFLFIRFGIVIPAILLLFVLSLTEFFRTYNQLVNCLGIIVSACALIYVTVTFPEGAQSYYVGLILILIYCYLFLGIRFYWASLTGFFILIAYFVGTHIYANLEQNLALNNYFFLIIANMMLMFGAYLSELTRRKEFLVRQALHEEKMKVTHINKGLEVRILERTNEIQLEVAERKIAQRTTQVALKEKEALLKEVYHRTKNNMNVIISLLNLQAHEQSSRPSPKVFSQLSDRIHSMSLVHEQLYGSSNLSTIQLGKYVESLATQRRYSLLRNPETITINIDSEQVEVGLEQAVPLGLALNEIITNAIKHGYQENQEGQIDIKIFKNESGNPEIKIANDGAAFPDSINIEKPETLGLRLLQILIVEQLQGRLELERDREVCFTIEVPN